MTEKGTFFLRRHDFGDKFYLVLAVEAGDSECSPHERAKHFRVMIEEQKNIASHVGAVLFITFVFILGPYLITWAVTGFERLNGKLCNAPLIEDDEEPIVSQEKESELQDLRVPGQRGYGTLDDSTGSLSASSTTNATLYDSQAMGLKGSDHKLWVSEWDNSMNYGSKSVAFFRTHADLYVNHLTRKVPGVQV